MRRLVAVCALVFLAPTSGATDRDVVVTLRPSAVVAGRVLRLGHVADVRTADAARAERLRRIVIGHVPLAGRPKELTRADVESRCARSGADDVTVGGAARVTVEARVVEFDVAAVRAVARARLEAALADIDGATIEERSSALAPISVAAGLESTRIVAELPESFDARGTVPVAVRALADGVVVAVRLVPFDVRREARALVLVRAVAPGEPIEASDIELRPVDATSADAGRLVSPRRLARTVARRALRPGTILTESMLRRLPSVRRDEMVTVVVRAGALSIRARAIALGDGHDGDVVVLKNPASGRRIRGLVVGPGLVEVKP